jgi:DNA-binding transcriptional regulator YhcF (GntR family)
MKLWISKGGAETIQEQLSAQIVLGVVSGDLAPGERLPSTPAIARRFHIHANTVSAVYRQLTKRRWLEWKRGSGFFVRDRASQLDTFDPDQDLDRLIAAFLSVARSRGHSPAEIQSKITRWLSPKNPDYVIVIEPDPELREILVAEIASRVSVRVTGSSLEGCQEAPDLNGALCTALYDHSEEVRSALPEKMPCMFLRSRSAPQSMTGKQKPGPDTLIVVASRWPDFLKWSRILLVAVGIDAAAIELRDARQKGWKRGVTAESFIITDSLLASDLPKGPNTHVFSLIADESIDELRQACGEPLSVKVIAPSTGRR